MGSRKRQTIFTFTSARAETLTFFLLNDKGHQSQKYFIILNRTYDVMARGSMQTTIQMNHKSSKRR